MTKYPKIDGRDGAPPAADATDGPGTATEIPGRASEDGVMSAPNSPPRATVRAALERAGWRLDADEPHVTGASDGERYGVAVAFENGQPVALEYGDGGQDLQHCEIWDEAPGILAPADVSRLLREEKGNR